ncbi:hypothetical protein KC960_05600, partial [Candidatus Saccharibacteria bacterium]|nr:hypothetical protein [Candidatus Saccharibacteria bacterium]
MNQLIRYFAPILLFMLWFQQTTNAQNIGQIFWHKSENLDSIVNPDYYSISGAKYISKTKTVVALWSMRRSDRWNPTDTTKMNNEYPVVITWKHRDSLGWNAKKLNHIKGWRNLWVSGDSVYIGMGTAYPGNASDYYSDMFVSYRTLDSFKTCNQKNKVPSSGAGLGILNEGGLTESGILLHGAGDKGCSTSKKYYRSFISGGLDWSKDSFPSLSGLTHAQALQYTEDRPIIMGGLSNNQCNGRIQYASDSFYEIKWQGTAGWSIDIIRLSNAPDARYGFTVSYNNRIFNLSRIKDKSDGTITSESDSMMYLDASFGKWNKLSSPIILGKPHPNWLQQAGASFKHPGARIVKVSDGTYYILGGYDGVKTGDSTHNALATKFDLLMNSATVLSIHDTICGSGSARLSMGIYNTGYTFSTLNAYESDTSSKPFFSKTGSLNLFTSRDTTVWLSRENTFLGLKTVRVKSSVTIASLPNIEIISEKDSGCWLDTVKFNGKGGTKYFWEVRELGNTWGDTFSSDSITYYLGRDKDQQIILEGTDTKTGCSNYDTLNFPVMRFYPGRFVVANRICIGDSTRLESYPADSNHITWFSTGDSDRFVWIRPLDTTT